MAKLSTFRGYPVELLSAVFLAANCSGDGTGVLDLGILGDRSLYSLKSFVSHYFFPLLGFLPMQ